MVLLNVVRFRVNVGCLKGKKAGQGPTLEDREKCRRCYRIISTSEGSNSVEGKKVMLRQSSCAQPSLIGREYGRNFQLGAKGEVIATELSGSIEKLRRTRKRVL